jgi:carbon monoxide dehydrogenase subunit G
VHRTEASIEIAAPPEAVYRLLARPEERLRWVQGLVESEETEPGRFREVVSDHGVRTSVDVETVRAEPPHALDARMTNRHLDATVRNRLEATPDGTRLTVTVESAYRGVLARAAAGLVTRHAQTSLEQSVENLRSLAESDTAAV